MRRRSSVCRRISGAGRRFVSAARPSARLDSATARRYRWRHADLNLYAPWLAPQRGKAELGFCLILRDPRAPLPTTPEGWRAWQENPHPRQRWRWVKVFVGWRRSTRVLRRRVLTAEVETHLTRGPGQRHTVKSFVRFKAGRGGLAA